METCSFQMEPTFNLLQEKTTSCLKVVCIFNEPWCISLASYNFNFCHQKLYALIGAGSIHCLVSCGHSVYSYIAILQLLFSIF